MALQGHGAAAVLQPSRPPSMPSPGTDAECSLSLGASRLLEHPQRRCRDGGEPGQVAVEQRNLVQTAHFPVTFFPIEALRAFHLLPYFVELEQGP